VLDVTVVTATFNSARVIERNIRCVASQTLRPKEHIIIDDGSRDDTISIVERLQEEFPHLQIIRQSNGGAATARNAGIERATGRYIAFLDCDDVWASKKLESQIGFMADNEIAFSYGEYDIVEVATGNRLGRHKSPEQVTYDDLLRGCPVGCLTVAFDQEMLGKRYMPEVRRGQDWGCWLELTRDGTVGHRYPGCHATYRRSKGSLSSEKVFKVGDVYSIYRAQEQLGPIRAVRFMIPHVFWALTKRHVVSGRKLKRVQAGTTIHQVMEEQGT
jgi:teichuronic acid biosynthesis glycosyltransferase TuaG